jgi:hypothetical protein
MSATTIIDRANKLECYKPHREGQAHDLMNVGGKSPKNHRAHWRAV